LRLVRQLRAERQRTVFVCAFQDIFWSKNDTGATVRKAGLFAEPVLQGVGDEVAEFGEAFGLFAKDVVQDSGDGEDPMAVWDRQADLVANEDGGVKGAALVAARAAAPALAGKGEQVVMAAVGTLHSEEAAGEAAAVEIVTCLDPPVVIALIHDRAHPH